MWWKFWTWFRHDDTSQHVTKAPRKVRSFSGAVPGTDGEGPEDILGSLSELIEEQSPEPTDFIQPTRSTESVELVEQTAAVDPPRPAVPVDTFQKTSKPSDLLQHFDQHPSPNAEPSRAAKPVRPSPASKRDESQKDARQTLVADDILRALSERFKNFDQSKDDDEGNGPSPYQTIVPNDD